MKRIVRDSQGQARDTRALLNLGCGQNRPAGWINTDSSLNSIVQRIPVLGAFIGRIFGKTQYDEPASYMDLRKSWPFMESSIDVVYASHVFEHLDKYASDLFLIEARRVLKGHGVIRLVVPDLNRLAEKYVAEYRQGDPNASDRLLSTMNLHVDNCYERHDSLITKAIHLLQGFPIVCRQHLLRSMSHKVNKSFSVHAKILCIRPN